MMFIPLYEIPYQLVLYIYFHYICKEALTTGPLDEGGHELDLVGLVKSCPPPDKVSGKVAVCGIGARPSCLCFPEKPWVLKSFCKERESILPACPPGEEVLGRRSAG